MSGTGPMHGDLMAEVSRPYHQTHRDDPLSQNERERPFCHADPEGLGPAIPAVEPRETLSDADPSGSSGDSASTADQLPG